METRSRKRNRSDNNEVKSKCQRAAKTKQLTDLNVDVLAQIFEYLNIDEMINTAKASKILLNSIQRAFQKRYRNEYIKLPLGETTTAFKRSIEVLRYFGKDISKLKLNYDILERARNKEIHDLAMEVCHRTLIEIKFRKLSPDLKINKCFPVLKTLDIFGGSIDGSVCKLGKWFPVVENFVINCVGNIVAKNRTKFDTQQNYASMKCFRLDFCLNSKYKFNIHQLNDFIKFNPQVNELSLTLVEDMFGSTKNSIMRIENEDHEIVNDQMITVKLQVYSGNLAELTIPYGRVKQLELRTLDCETHTQICSFIANCVNMKILKLVMWLCCSDIKSMLHNTFAGVAKHSQLTQLEISFEASRRIYGNVFEFGLMAIQALLQHHRQLNTVKLTYVSNIEESWMQDAHLSFSSHIDLKLWSLTHENSNRQVTFTLNKLK